MRSAGAGGRRRRRRLRKGGENKARAQLKRAQSADPLSSPVHRTLFVFKNYYFIINKRVQQNYPPASVGRGALAGVGVVVVAELQCKP